MKIHFGEKSNRKPNQNHQKTELKSSVHSRHFKRIVQQSENNTFVLKNNVRQKQEKKKRSWEWKNVLVFIDVRNHIEIIKNETKKKVRKKDTIYDGCRIINFVFFTCVVCECLWFVIILRRKYIFSPTHFNQKKKIGAVNLKFCVYNRSPDKY